MKNARIYDFAMTAGGSFQLNVEGENVRLMTCTGPVELVADGYRIGPIFAGQGQGNSPFKRLTINDKSGLPNKGTILISSADFIDDRITGEVSVIDGGKARTLANLAFAGTCYIAANAGTVQAVQLWNPPASGKNIIVQQMTFIGQASPYASQCVDTAAFPTPYSQLNPYAKKSGGLASSAEMRSMSTPTASAIGLAFLPQGIVYRLMEPFVIGPGSGFSIRSTSLGAECGGMFEFYEDAI